MTFTLEDAIKKFPEIAYWHSEFEKHNTITAPAEPVKQEPVAWMEDCIEFYASDRPSSTFTIPLYAAPVDAKAIRAEALEEVKQFIVTQWVQVEGIDDIAESIEVLK